MPRKKTTEAGSDLRLETVEKRMAALSESMGGIAGAVNNLTKLVQDKLEQPQAPAQLPMAEREEDVLTRFQIRQGQQRDERQGFDLRFPQAAATGLQPKTVVRVKEGTEKATLIRAGLKLLPEMPLPLGVVKRFLYVTKGGQRKHLVFFKGLGDDGFLEGELEVCQN